MGFEGDEVKANGEGIVVLISKVYVRRRLDFRSNVNKKEIKKGNKKEGLR